MNRWHVVQFERGRHVSVATEIALRGFEAYCPMLAKRKITGGNISEVNYPRFGIYMFALFDRAESDWARLLNPKGTRAGIVRLLGNDPMRPIPVPTEAIEAMRAYEPAAVHAPTPYRYQPGEPCHVYISGVRKQAVFVDYKGSRQFVRAWIFGAEHVVEVKSAELEPMDIDNPQVLTTKSA